MPGLCKIRHAVALMSVALVINGAMLSSLSATDCNSNGRADVEDIALGAMYLCSPAAAYVTGDILGVNGGMVRLNMQMPRAWGGMG